MLKNMFYTDDFKVWAITWFAFFYTAEGDSIFTISIQDIGDLLRILLLLLSSCYSGYKLYKLIKDDKTND